MIEPATLSAWRADAVKHGGVPREGDVAPHARYLANRVVALIDMITGELAHVTNDQLGSEPEEYHDGVLYGIRHPGVRDGCPYCTATLKQAEHWEPLG